MQKRHLGIFPSRVKKSSKFVKEKKSLLATIRNLLQKGTSKHETIRNLSKIIPHKSQTINKIATS